MSKTVSFRASEELDEFLEQEAERRMTTKSTVAQMLLAERVRELKSERDGETGSSSESAQTEDDQLDQGLPEVFDQHSDHWYRPDSDKYQFAVRLPGHDETKYYKTQDHAATRLEKEYSS